MHNRKYHGNKGYCITRICYDECSSLVLFNNLLGWSKYIALRLVFGNVNSGWAIGYPIPSCKVNAGIMTSWAMATSPKSVHIH